MKKRSKVDSRLIPFLEILAQMIADDVLRELRGERRGSKYAELERKHLGDPVKRTGIYAPRRRAK